MGVTIISGNDICRHCGKMRKFHQRPDLFCPAGKMKGGVYVEFRISTVFEKQVEESAIDKYKIAPGQIYLSADGASHGFLVRDVHKDPAGDYLTVQKITPQGQDGPLTRVHAFTMTQRTHYGWCDKPNWWPKLGKK